MKFVFFPLSQVLAHVSRSYEVARVLRDRGHDVVFAAENTTHHRSRMDIVAKAAFNTVPVREPNFSYLWERMTTAGFRGTVGAVCSPAKWMPVGEIMESQVEVIKAERPDAVAGFATMSMSNAAYIAGVPAVNVYNAYYIDGILSRRMWRFYWDAYDAVFLAAKRRGVYAKHGKPAIRAVDLFLSVPLLSPDLPGMYETSGVLRNARMTGPILFDYPAPAPDWFSELDDGTKNVYLTMGSTGVLDVVLRAALDSLAKLPYRFIVTTGGQVDRGALGDLPTNFRMTDFAPGAEILKRCSALVFHGGNGSMYQALQHGVPMLAVPTHNEQRINARIAAGHGFCRILELRDAVNGMLAGAVREIVESESCRSSAQRMAGLVRASDGANTAADIIENTAREGRPPGAASN
ncbi:MAG: hypothetical protein HUU46_14520 [Candidatus Hydrogenedentes bacterium]|nr:hypothetical protein [Candidatus Hydrogenedentota bacterium]